LDIGYQIRVELLDGRMIESAFEEVQRVGGDDKLIFSVRQRERFDEETGKYIPEEKAIIELQSTISNLQQNPKRLRWHVARTYKFADIPETLELRDPTVRSKFIKNKTCYVTDFPSSSNIFLFDGFNANRDETKYSSEVFNIITNDYKFLDTMLISVVQEGLSEGAFTYYERISELISITGNMFESPVAKIRSNFINILNPEEEVFGYFYATEQKTSRIKITTDMVGDIIPDENNWVFNTKVGAYDWENVNGKARHPCNTSPNSDVSLIPRIFGECPTSLEEACCDCLVIENSTTKRPAFFD